MSSKPPDVFQTLDGLLGVYYKTFGINNYFESQKKHGRFLQFIINEELNDDGLSIDDELGENVKPKDCAYLSFDEQFPLNVNIESLIKSKQIDRDIAVFYVLQHMYISNKIPTTQDIINRLDGKSLDNNQYNNDYNDVDTVDVNNCQILHDLRRKFDQINTRPSFNHDGLLNAYTKKQSDIRCKVKTCGAFQRIKNILKEYQQYIYNDKALENVTIDDIFKNDYNDIKLLNDYHHLLLEHDNEFEEIYNRLVIQNNDTICQLSSCYMMQRNQRDRTNLNRNDNEIKRMYKNSDTQGIVKHQLLDTIHCYFLHSFDTGYRVSENQRNIMQQKIKIDEDSDDSKRDDAFIRNSAITQISEFIQSKRETYRNVDDLRRLQQNNDKFTTIIGSDDDEKKDVAKTYYSFGYRYFYWDCYKNNGDTFDKLIRPSSPINLSENPGYTLRDWYIPPKFTSLKEELLKNAICFINQTQWNNHWRKAALFTKTDTIQPIRATQICAQSKNSVRILSQKIYGIPHDEPVSCTHIVAMMIYCNETELQNKFSATYRRIASNETDEALKKRHSNYHHWGRLLRELVECFGTKNEDDHPFITGHLYHGISVETLFHSLHTKINGPVSTTSDYCIAANFCANRGLIVEFILDRTWCFGMDNNYHAFWDCRYLSDFTNEQERFLIGGYGTFVFKTIIAAPHGRDYKYYIRAMIQFSMALEGNPRAIHPINKPQTDDAKLIMYRLLSHRLHVCYPEDTNYHKFKTMPKYIDNLVNNHCNNIKKVSLHDYVMDRCKFRKQLFQSLFFYDYGWFKLDVLISIFPMIEYIVLEYDKKDENAKLLQSKSLYLALFQFVSKRVNNNLKRIELWYYNKDEITVIVNKMIDTMNEKFLKFGWKMCCKAKVGSAYGSKNQTIFSIESM